MAPPPPTKNKTDDAQSITLLRSAYFKKSADDFKLLRSSIKAQQTAIKAGSHSRDSIPPLPLHTPQNFKLVIEQNPKLQARTQ